MQEVWREDAASPAGIEAALRQRVGRLRGGDDESRALLVPARVLNLVAIVDADRRREIETRLRGAGRLYPSRLIVCAVEHDRAQMEARGGIGTDDANHVTGRLAVTYEHVEITLGPQHLPGLDTIVDMLLVPDISTVVWSPHGHDEGVDALRRLAQVVMIDSHEGQDAATALARAGELARDSYLVDLAWLRSTPWRERLAALFDPAEMRPGLEAITRVSVRYRDDSLATALLWCGWLSARLRWRPLRLTDAGDALRGHAHAHDRVVTIELRTAEVEAPGLAGVSIELSSGAVLSLDRAPGGLRTTHRGLRGADRVATFLGASRGEAGILGEGVRQTLLRDPTYHPALRAASRMLL